MRKILRLAKAATLLALVWTNLAHGQVPEYVYRATRYMPQGESREFSTLGEAESYIKTEPATPIGNAFLNKSRSLAFSEREVLLEYTVPRRKYESYEGGYFDGHMSGNSTACFGYKCRSEEEMVAASMRAYPLSNNYTPTLSGAYLSPPFTMWSAGGDRGQSAMVTMNAVHYSGASIPNERTITATNSNGGSYVYRINRKDEYRCPQLFTATNNDYGEPRYGLWPNFCINGAHGHIVVRFKQRAPYCQVPSDRPGNPCAADFGNKEYREDDFTWDGFDFKRAYNSIADFSLSSGLGDNWSHTFSDHLAFDNGGYPTYWVRPDGYVERFYVLESGSQIYFSPNSPNLVLTKPVKGASDPQDGVWKIVIPGQKAIWFDAEGKLVRKQVAGTSVDLAYCRGAELGTAVCPFQNLIRRAQNSRGRVLEFSYAIIPGADQQSRLVLIESDARVLMEYKYDSLGRLTAAWHGGVEDEGRRYVYGESNFLCRSAGGVAIANCDPAKYPNHLTGIQDELGIRFANYSYDEKGRVTASEHAGGAGRVTVDYISATQSLATLASGATKAYVYTNEDLKKLSGVTTSGGADAVTQTTNVGYDSRWRVVSNSISGGSRTNFGYSGPNQTARTEGLSEAGATTELTRTTQIDWNTSYNQPSERRLLNSAGAVVSKDRWTYNSRGQPTAVTAIDPVTGEERSTTTAYCEQSDVDAGHCPLMGSVISIDGPRTDVSDITLYDYYPADATGCASSPQTCAYRKGDLWKVTDAAGQSTEMLRYDTSGRILSSKDRNGVVTDIEYSARGWLLAIKVRGANDTSEADDKISRMEYWPTGLISKSTLPDGDFLNYDYDAAHRLTEMTDGSGNSIRYTLDNEGNRIKEETRASGNALKRTLSRVYNSVGQLQANKDAAGHATAYRYDARGNQDRSTDALGSIIDNAHDPLNRLVRTLQDVGGLSADTKFEYNAADQLTKITDPKGLDTIYTYNGFGDQIRLTSPDTGVTDYTYDSAGNIKTRTDARNVTTNYSYDALGRMIRQAYPTAVLGTTYSYDTVAADCPAGETFSKGHLSQSNGTGGVYRYCYDRFGHMVRKTVHTTGPVLALRYTYTLSGALKSLAYPDGTVVDYLRGAHGRITQIGVTRPGAPREILLTAVGYHPFGPSAGWVYGNGQPMTRNVDQNYAASRLVGSIPDGLSLYLTRDEVGNVTRLSTENQSSILARYRYDRLGRLIQTQDGPSMTPLETYGYDTTGNRTSVQNAAGTQNYIYPATNHRLQSVGGVAREYDAIGNTTSIGGTAKQFVYNDLGRMSQFKADGVTKMYYAYNGDGQQVRRYSSTSILHSLYAEDGRWLGEYGDTGVAHQQVIWLDDLPVGVISGIGSAQKLFYIEPDHLGSPRVVIDPSRNAAVWKWDLSGEAFGSTQPNQDPDLDGTMFMFDLRFPGQRYDAATGMNYNYFRDYDPGKGGYLQSDPVGLVAGVSTYGYVSGSPLIWADMYGLLQWSLLPVQWNGGTATGALTRTYPGAPQSEFRDNTLARTTMDWNISARCTCSAGSYSLDEFEVSLTPIVLLRQRYDSPEIRRSTRRDELDHVRDLNAWANGARIGAEQFENGFKSQSFSSEQACLEAARAAMQGHLSSGIGPAVTDSNNRWDVSGRHRLIVPGN